MVTSLSVFLPYDVQEYDVQVRYPMTVPVMPLTNASLISIFKLRMTFAPFFKVRYFCIRVSSINVSYLIVIKEIFPPGVLRHHLLYPVSFKIRNLY